MGKLSLKMQLGVGFGALVATVAVMGIVGFRAAVTTEGLVQTVEFNSKNKDLTLGLQLLLETENVADRDALLSGHAEKLAAARAKFQQRMDELKPLLSTPESQKLFADISDDSIAYNAIVDRVLAADKSGNMQEAVEYGSKAQAARSKLEDSTKGLVDWYAGLAAAAIQQETASARGAKALLLILALAGLAAGIVVAGVITRSISLAIKDVVGVVDRISKGDISANVPDGLRGRKDEIGALAAAMQIMTESLRTLLGGISSGVQTLSSAAAELSAVSRRTASGTASMSDKANIVASAAEQASFYTASIATGMEHSSSSRRRWPAPPSR